MSKHKMCRGIQRLFSICAIATIPVYALNIAAAPKATGSPEVASQELELRWLSHGYLFRSPSLDVRMGARLHLDGAWPDTVSSAKPSGFAHEVRRARGFIRVNYSDDWRLGLDVDLADLKHTRVKSSWVGYYGFRNSRIRLGQQLPAYGLEETTSSDNLGFMERSLQHVFAPDYALGASLQYHSQKPWTVALGVFNKNQAISTADSHFATARVTFSRQFENNTLFHTGISSVYTFSTGTDFNIRYRPRPESHIVQRGLISSTRMKDVKSSLLTNLEFAVAKGPFLLQSEVARIHLSRHAQDSQFNGWYVSGGWLLTGESHNYDSRYGRFRSVTPKSRYGAFELSLRFSMLDLGNRTQINRERNTSIGLNWYLRKNLRLSLNRVVAKVQPLAESPETEKWVQLRLQLRI